MQRRINFRTGHGKESYNVTKVTKVKTLCSGRLQGTPLAPRGSEPLLLEPCTSGKRGGERQFIGRFKAAAGRNAARDTRERDRLVLK